MRSSRMSYIFHEERNRRGIRKIRKRQVKTTGLSKVFNSDSIITSSTSQIAEKKQSLEEPECNEQSIIDNYDLQDDLHLNLSETSLQYHPKFIQNNSNESLHKEVTINDEPADHCSSESECDDEFSLDCDDDGDENDDEKPSSNQNYPSDTSDEEMFSSMSGLLHPYLTLTKSEVMFMIMNIFVRHNLSNAALSDILKLINIIVGFQAIPETFSKFSNFFTKKTFTRHYTCDKCGYYMGETKSECKVCRNQTTSFFVAFDFISNLRNIVKNNWDSIVAYQSEVSRSSNITDILNAGVLRAKELRNAITLSFNTDGVKIFNSNVKKSLWPIILCINELPPNLRFLRKNVLVAGLWLKGSEPNLETFLKPFCEVLTTVFAEGLSIGPERFVSTVQVVACCVDTMARCKLQNMKQFNGYNACGFCHHPGDLVGKQIRYSYKQQLTKRTHQDTLHEMAISNSTGKPVNGVKGISPLIMFPGFDVIRNCPVDYMHCILLGITRQLCRVWFETPSSFSYIKNKISYIDEMLTSINYFHEASRTARKLSDRATWKANEWLHWLIHYSSLCLKQYLPQEYFDHFKLLVTTVIKLLNTEISPTTYTQCQMDLEKFVCNFERLYGIEEMTYNVHLLVHLVDCARDYGPLWAFSLFVYEDINGVLKKYVKGPNEPLIQIVNRYALFQIVHNGNTCFMQPIAAEFCRKVSSAKSTDQSVKNKVYTLDYNIINKYNCNNQFEILRKVHFNRFMFKSVYNTTINVKHKKKPHNDCYFSIVDNEDIIIGQIQEILKDSDGTYFLFKPVLVSATNDSFEISSIDDQTFMIKVNNTLQKWIKVELESKYYLIKLHYSLHVD